MSERFLRWVAREISIVAEGLVDEPEARRRLLFLAEDLRSPEEADRRVFKLHDTEIPSDAGTDTDRPSGE